MPDNVRVAVNRYGVIGKRVADAVRAQPDMELVGVWARPGASSFDARPTSGGLVGAIVSTPLDVGLLELAEVLAK
jgi:hypothetical protein